MIRLLILFLFFAMTAVFANKDRVVNVYIWANYIPQSVIELFEHKTGISVNLSEYDSNEDLYAKLKADPHSGYDVIVPSSYFVERMRREGMLHKLNQKLLTNRKQLNPLLLNAKFDPHNRYSYPYLWGTTGIAVDRRYWNPKTIRYWKDLWQPRFRNQLLLYDDVREVFAMAMIVLKRSINERDPHYIKKAFTLLEKLMPNVRLFSTDAAINVFADDDVTVGMAESGDIILARPANPYLTFIYPKDGFAIWEDSLAVPKYAPHFKNAMLFMNFLMSTKVGVMVSLGQGYSSPNLAVRQQLPKKLRNDPVMYPSQATLKRGHMEGSVGGALPVYMQYWELLKLL